MFIKQTGGLDPISDAHRLELLNSFISAELQMESTVTALKLRRGWGL